MREVFAISLKDNSLIVRAGTTEELARKLDDIMEKYPDYALEFIVMHGIKVVEGTIRDAKKGRPGDANVSIVHLDPALPLFSRLPGATA